MSTTQFQNAPGGGGQDPRKPERGGFSGHYVEPSTTKRKAEAVEEKGRREYERRAENAAMRRNLESTRQENTLLQQTHQAPLQGQTIRRQVEELQRQAHESATPAPAPPRPRPQVPAAPRPIPPTQPTATRFSSAPSAHGSEFFGQQSSFPLGQQPTTSFPQSRQIAVASSENTLADSQHADPANMPPTREVARQDERGREAVERAAEDFLETLAGEIIEEDAEMDTRFCE
ncbi:MAG: hypothetical protein Q9227_003221 [Pyrenula ochraceoflavens]